MARIKNTNVYIFDNVPEPSSFLVGSDQGDGRITKSYRIDTIFGLLPSYGYFTDAPADGQPYLRQDNSWVPVPEGSGAGDVFKVFGRTGNILAREEDYDNFYSLLGHTHTESDITDLQAYLLPSDIGDTVQAWSTALDNVSGVNSGDQDSIVGITGDKSEFNTALTDGDFMFVGDAPTTHTHTESDITDLKDYLLEADLNTLAKLNAIITDATLIDTNDPRLTDARTPLSHTHLEADITDLKDYLLSVDIDDINATGTPSSSTWLRGDGAWGTITAGVSTVFGRNVDVVAQAGDYDDFYYTESEIDTLLIDYELLANKGLANGYAPLNASGLIDSSFLPAFVDDVLEYADEASFPATGEVGKIYMDIAENTLFRWTGSVYVQVGGTDNIPWGGITGLLSNQTDLTDKFGEYLPLTGGTVIGDTSFRNLNHFGQGGFSGSPIRIYGTDEGTANIVYYQMNDSAGTRKGYLGFPSSDHDDMIWYNDTSASYIALKGGGGANDLIYFYGGASQKIWHQGNDGAGSGLDADNLDGVSWGNVNTDIILTSSNAKIDVKHTGGSAVSRIGSNASGGYWIGTDEATNTTSIIRSYGTTELYGGQVNSYNGGFAAYTSGDGGTLFAFNTERPWTFRQGNTGAATSLDLIEPTGSKQFRIGNDSDKNLIRFFAANGNIISKGSITTANDVIVGGNVARLTTNTGFLEGSYNTAGANGAQTNPIYTIGSVYNPNATTLGNMYGIGFSYGPQASFLNSTDLGTNPSGWGMYVVAAGGARIFLDANNGHILAGGSMYADNFILSSDIKKKTKIKDIEKDYDVRWREFEMKKTKGEKRYGVIAQELQETHPEFVSDDGIGNLSVKYTDLLVAKMAEKDRQIELLNNKLDLLIKELL